MSEVNHYPESVIRRIEQGRVHDPDLSETMARAHEAKRTEVLAQAEQAVNQAWEEHIRICSMYGYRSDSLGPESQYKKNRLEEWKKIAEEDGEQAALDCAERERKVDQLFRLETNLVQELDAYNRLLGNFKRSAQGAREKRRTLESRDMMRYLSQERVAEEYSQRLNFAYHYRDLVIRQEMLIERLLGEIDEVRKELHPSLPPMDWTQKFTRDQEANELSI